MPEKDVYRMTVSLPMETYKALEAWAKEEGRRASNLAAHLIDRAIVNRDQGERHSPASPSEKPLAEIVKEDLETLAREQGVTPAEIWQQLVQAMANKQEEE